MPVRQKKLIVILLAASCIAAIFLLIDSTTNSSKKLTSGAQLDSLITETLDDFNIPNSQYRKRTVKIDSAFSRAIYIIDLAPDISKTALHYHLHKKVLPYVVESPARILMPEKEMNIHLDYKGTITHTIVLRTDRELQRAVEISVD